VNLGLCQYAGKGQGEVSLLRRLQDVLRPGDVVLGYRLLGNWATIVFLAGRGVVRAVEVYRLDLIRIVPEDSRRVSVSAAI
jgi:hypothetical protein